MSVHLNVVPELNDGAIAELKEAIKGAFFDALREIVAGIATDEDEKAVLAAYREQRERNAAAAHMAFLSSIRKQETSA
ncbi:hypothetical protein E2F47_22220 [Mycobacterium eburneum]|nr:hypothetical protein [Mycobacterium eburneum]TDH48884.1 hypothetical protein E2F47_22220 [Mycobacterium eburneum]